MDLEVRIRNATENDIDSMLCLYSQIVVMSTGSLDVRLPTEKEINRNREYAQEHNCPCFVAEVSGEIVGFAFSMPYGPETGYINTVTEQVYVHPEAQGEGVGTQLLTALIANCETVGYRQMLAFIGDKDNKVAIALHEKCGFKKVGELKSIGWKFGKWLDTVIYQKTLPPGDTTVPSGVV